MVLITVHVLTIKHKRNRKPYDIFFTNFVMLLLHTVQTFSAMQKRRAYLISFPMHVRCIRINPVSIV